MNRKILMVLLALVSIRAFADDQPCEIVIRTAGPTWTQVQANVAIFKAFAKEQNANLLEEKRFETSQLFYNEVSLAKRKPEVANFLRASMKPFLESPDVTWTDSTYEREATMPASKIVFKGQGRGIGFEFSKFVTQQNKNFSTGYFATLEVKCAGVQQIVRPF